ncbi:MAG: hypothetical protein R2709_01490 [Marmoricola sp.]
MNELEFEDFAQQISDAVESFLVSLQAISREGVSRGRRTPPAA